MPVKIQEQASVEIPVLPQDLEVWQQTLNWQPDSSQQTRFQKLYELILAGNRQLNLTRITNPQDFLEKHLWDSLRGIKPWLGNGTWDMAEAVPSAETSFKVIDIGTGAGFPGLPVAIALPQWQVTLLDSTRKKMAFVDSLLTELEISNAVTLTDRVEQIGHSSYHRQVYDLALVRAVANAAVCAEYALPLLKIGGVAVLYRGQWTEEEAIVLERTLEQLGGELTATEAFKTPVSQSDRHCLYLKKVAPTPISLPRPVGVAAKLPL
ncbi:MAG: 16S rRNA (guanine(527)-N(7))-methyltransferase RsmG [Drouetiella hepatica Uher 2000/2452]|uniref:Ribosomal RNA small subunit methyltransferase G n=1 Tax=Drouetiella hepatica Uher 2000/2452 TaxID=904376 RepID=A0A951QI63_9CYAN|nr:16S rRNA (guanine(527)-N(7))-methyltransferase RsmG [Drouetiella hepatica Uher 2000/2452]